MAKGQNLIHEPKSKADGGHVDKIVAAAKEFSQKLTPLKNQLKTLKEKTIHEEKYPNIPEDTYIGIDQTIAEFETHIQDFATNVDSFADDIKRVIDDKIELLKVEKNEDRVLREINSKFRIGKEFSYEQQLKISEEGAFRYSEQIPPGYEDAEEKIGMQKYGDLFAWKQILEIGKKEKKPILLVINDVKEDWHDSELDAPRFELLKEFQSVCKQPFWTFTMKQFIYHMNQIIETEQDVSEQMLKETDAIEEVKNYDVYEDIDYKDMINEFLAPEICVDSELPLHDEWRIIGHTKIYTGTTEEGKAALVMVNKIKGSNYTSGLHPLRNMHEVKKYFERNKVTYDYTQFLVASTEEVAKSIIKKQFEKKNIKNLYNKKSTSVFVGYIEDNYFKYITSNMDIE